MNFHQLALLAEVVDKGSFTLAAHSLFLSQSAVSTQIRHLEREVGLPLFRQVRGGLVLSEAGSLLYDTARSMISQKSVLEQRLADLRSGDRGAVAVGVSHTGAFYSLIEAVQDYMALNPQVRIEVEVDLAANVFRKLVDGKLELGIEWEPVRQAELAAERLKTMEFLVALNPANPLALSGEVQRDDFLSQRYLSLQYGPGQPSFVEEQLLRANLLPPNIARPPTIDATKRMIEAGLGVSMLSRISVERELANGRLVARPLAGFRLSRAIVMLFRRGWTLSPQAGAFAEFLRSWSRT